jgi:hypothetical protein
MPHAPDNTVINVVLRVGTWALHRVRRDHSSLYGGWYTQNYGNRRYIYLSAACAPSRRFRHPRLVRASDAHRFIEATFGVPFDPRPAQSLREVVAFEDQPKEDAMDPLRAVRLNDNGRVELFWRISHETTAGSELVIPIVDLFAPLYELVRAVERGLYRELYKLPSRARRLDWFVAVSPHVSTDTGWSEWHDLRFPGDRPQMRASRATPALSPFGLAHVNVRSRSQRTPPRDLLRPIIDDFLTNSGWDGNDAAIQATLDAFEVRTHRTSPN